MVHVFQVLVTHNGIVRCSSEPQRRLSSLHTQHSVFQKFYASMQHSVFQHFNRVRDVPYLQVDVNPPATALIHALQVR